MSAPIYLYTGPELGEKNEQILSLKDNLKKKYGSSDDFVYYGMDLDMGEVLSQLMTESLFTPATFVTIRNAELVKDKKDIEMLQNWILSASKKTEDSTVLVLVSDEMKVDSKLEKLVPSENKKIFWEMFENRKEQWLHSFFKKNGYSLESEAAQSILEMIENNTEALKTECSQFFFCFPAGHTVTSADVEKVLSHNREESAFSLFDAMSENFPAQKRLENCLSILQKIRLSKKDSTPVVITAGLSYCFRKLSLWQSLHSTSSPSDLDLKKNGFNSKQAQKQYARAGSVWTAGQVAAILSLISKTDVEIRSLGTSFQDTKLSMMLYEIIIKNGAYCCAYESDIFS
ncbi:DNA polymerase III subunit delta [Treponema pectinovorum]|uniref:DNA polymerase III subunit delta n=1 Tax=Treponema pectinovorum TaxID=164 RepID=UPI0011CAE381|nr:DNA polymerase III subunit delta [Treponema pectinovorum]